MSKHPFLVSSAVAALTLGIGATAAGASPTMYQPHVKGFFAITKVQDTGTDAGTDGTDATADGTDSSTDTSGSVDANVDADADVDTGIDSADSGVDAGVDADAGIDAGTDTTTGSSADTGSTADSGTESGTSDTSGTSDSGTDADASADADAGTGDTATSTDSSGSDTSTSGTTTDGVSTDTGTATSSTTDTSTTDTATTSDSTGVDTTAASTAVAGSSVTAAIGEDELSDTSAPTTELETNLPATSSPQSTTVINPGVIVLTPSANASRLPTRCSDTSSGTNCSVVTEPDGAIPQNQKVNAAPQQPQAATPSQTAAGRGLGITLFEPVRRQDGLFVQGVVVNTSDQSLKVPPMHLSLRNGSNEGVQHYLLDPPVAVLGPGENKKFKTIVPKIPEGVTNVNLAFVEDQ